LNSGQTHRACAIDLEQRAKAVVFELEESVVVVEGCSPLGAACEHASAENDSGGADRHRHLDWQSPAASNITPTASGVHSSQPRLIPSVERLEVRPVSSSNLSPLHAVGELWRPLCKAVALTRSRVGLALLFR
jgi:hypothetical protein